MPLQWLQFSIRRSLACLALALLGFFVGGGVFDPSMIRVVLAVALVAMMVGLTLRNRQLGMFVILSYLPVMALVRRILIPLTGWTQFDPLVLVVPIVVLLLGSFWIYRHLVLREPVRADTGIFKSIRWLLLIEIIEVFNPLQGGLSVGLSGAIFYVVPIVWFILGRIYFNRTWFIRVMVLSLIVGLAVSAYGLKQAYYGFFPFEQQWIDDVHIVSLHVGSVIRGFSTFSSSQEYSQYIAISLAIAWVVVLKARRWAKVFGLICVGVMGDALILVSARGTIVTCAAAIVLTTIMNAKTARGRLVVSFLLGLLLTGVWVVLSHVTSSNPLVSHVLLGIFHPFNSTDSTLDGHSGRMFQGIVNGFMMPIGHGLGSTTTGAGKFGGSNYGTEIDISNVFESDGVIGGMIYLVTLTSIFVKALKRSRSGDIVVLAALAVFVASIGQDLNGELYSTSALVWLFASYIEAIGSPSTERLWEPYGAGSTAVKWLHRSPLPLSSWHIQKESDQILRT